MADGQYNLTTQQVSKLSAEQNERDWATTMEIVKQAVLSFGPNPPADDLTLQKRCEAIWKWAKTENWTPPA